jgi:hypothetical protein
VITDVATDWKLDKPSFESKFLDGPVVDEEANMTTLGISCIVLGVAFVLSGLVFLLPRKGHPKSLTSGD